MKPSSVQPRRSLDTETAWGYLTTNLALPGFGSILGGRASGYIQAPLCVVGMMLTLTFGIRFVMWRLGQGSGNLEAQDDPVGFLHILWMHVRFALLGIGLFGIAWAWALATGLSLLREAKRRNRGDGPGIPPVTTNVPPRL